MQFWNTLKRKKEEFLPLQPNRVGLYTCGPTVYDFAHIGNFRAYIFEDILRRYLEYCGYAVNHIMNITDIDDKTIKRSTEEGVALTDYTQRYEKAFFEDRDALKIKPATLYPRATEHIPEMVAIIKKLREKGYTYEKDGSIYFSIERFPGYGKLSGMDLSSLKKGARVENDEYEKKDVRDFALWKSSKPGEPSYDTETGLPADASAEALAKEEASAKAGRPGWHIECSAMSMKYLGETFDIHTGGVDNIFPHHENEIAQSEAANGKPFARYFLHCAHLLVNNEKMAKSKGNFYTLRDLIEKGYDQIAIRYLLLSVHYRSPLNFTLEGLDQAETAVRRLQDFYRRIQEVCDGVYNFQLTAYRDFARQKFKEFLDDDLNISAALGAVFGLMKETNIVLEKDELDSKNAKEIMEAFLDFDKILGILGTEEILLSKEIDNLIKIRELARKRKDFQEADRIKKEIFEKGFILEDTNNGPRAKKR